MGRWEPNAQGRLAAAAIALFGERGYEQTTVAAIAERAGLTERTFFRHFADKREVLFSGGAELQELMTVTVAAAPAGAAPIDAVGAAVAAAGARLQERRDHALLRQAVIAANPELHERELIKLATLATAMAGALRERGVDEPGASLAAQAAIAAFRVGFERWISDPDPGDLPRRISESLTALRAVATGG